MAPEKQPVTLDNLGAQVLEHWEKHLPRRVARLQREGSLEAEVQAAADSLHDQALEQHRAGTLTYQEAYDALKYERAFPPESQDDRPQRDETTGQFVTPNPVLE